MLAYSLYTQFLIYKNKTHSAGWTFATFQVATILHYSSLFIFWVHKDHPYAIVSDCLCLCCVSHHRRHYWFQMPNVLLEFDYLSVSYPLRYVLILYRNNTEFVDTQISQKNEMSGFV